MYIFGTNIPDNPLTNIELARYARELKLTHFRVVFMRYMLPQYPFNVESGIVNFNTSSHSGTHWVCYYRNKNTTYIAQNYFRLPRQTIRENSNFIILFPQDAKNLTHIHADHYANNISLLEFKQCCPRVWSKEHSSVTIDLTITPTNGKYRQNFNRFYFPTGTI